MGYSKGFFFFCKGLPIKKIYTIPRYRKISHIIVKMFVKPGITPIVFKGQRSFSIHQENQTALKQKQYRLQY